MQGANIPKKIARPIQTYIANVGDFSSPHNNSGYFLYSQTVFRDLPLKYLPS